ncbi:MAG: hypothetical protein M3Y59_11075 [Myxococcota bacterium]|nr:hypothetical protein [Myxococcota bacterium]
MRRALIAAAAVFLCAFTTCGSKTQPASGAVVPLKDTCPTGDVAALEAEAVADLEATGDAGTPLSTGPALRPPRPNFTSRLLIPPAKPGEIVADFAGCLSLAEATAEAGARFPVPPPTRGPNPDQVRVNPMGEGIVIAHELSHACCLQGEATARVEGTKLVVTEKLTGTPCRCMCASTIRSAVGLSPGTYTVVVQVDESGSLRDAFQGEVTVTK